LTHNVSCCLTGFKLNFGMGFKNGLVVGELLSFLKGIELGGCVGTVVGDKLDF